MLYIISKITVSKYRGKMYLMCGVSKFSEGGSDMRCLWREKKLAVLVAVFAAVMVAASSCCAAPVPCVSRAASVVRGGLPHSPCDGCSVPSSASEVILPFAALKGHRPKFFASRAAVPHSARFFELTGFSAGLAGGETDISAVPTRQCGVAEPKTVQKRE